MAVPTAVTELTLDEAEAHVAAGAAYVDLGDLDDYLDVHVHGSFGLQYEAGPGFASRARDCLPLDLPMVLMHSDHQNVGPAAAALRGKGFTVLGALPGGVRTWAEVHGSPASTERHSGTEPPDGVLLHVGEAGVPPLTEALLIPLEELADRTDEVPRSKPIVVCGGRGIRSGLAVGLLERAGIDDILFWGQPRASRSFGKAAVVTVQPGR